MGSSYTAPQSLCEDQAIIEQRAQGERLTRAIRDRRESRERLRALRPPEPEPPGKEQAAG